MLPETGAITYSINCASQRKDVMRPDVACVLIDSICVTAAMSLLCHCYMSQLSGKEAST